MGNGMRVPSAALRGGRLIAKAKPAEVRVLRFRYCSNPECERRGHFWQYEDQSQLKHCPECDAKTTNHTLDSQDRTAMLRQFASGVLDHVRGEVCWKMLGASVQLKTPGEYALTLVPARIFVGHVEAGRRVAVFAKPTMLDEMTDKARERALRGAKEYEALQAALDTRPQEVDGEVNESG